MTLTSEQLALRRDGITATDIGAILGLNPWKKPIDVQLDKLGHGEPVKPNARMLAGQRLEPGMREDYAERHGFIVVEPGTIVHATHDWARGTPDGIACSAEEVNRDGWPNAIEGVEFKVVGARRVDDWGEPGTDEVPPYVHTQCDWYMFLTEIERWRVVAKIDLEDYEYLLDRDRDLEKAMVERAHDFWQRHVLTAEPIPPDGSDAMTAFLRDRLPCHKVDDYLQTGEDRRALIHALYEIRRQAAAIATEDARLVQELKLAIGEHAGLEFPAITGRHATQRITWKRSRDSRRTDWELVARTYRALLLEDHATEWRGKLDEIEAAATATIPGSRRFNVPRNWR